MMGFSSNVALAMEKGNYFLDEQLLGVPHTLFNGNHGLESQDFLLFICSIENLDIQALNLKGMRYFKTFIDQGIAGEAFFKRVVHPEDQGHFLHHLRICGDLEDDQEKEIVIRLRSPFGYWKTFQIKTRNYHGIFQGNKKYILNLAKAADPYKHAYKKSPNPNLEKEKALQESLNRYRILVNSLDDGFCIIEVLFNSLQEPVDYLFMEINPAFEKHVHLRNILGRTMKELSRNHGKKWFDIYGQVILTGEAVRFEEYAHDLGVWFDIYAFPIGSRKTRKVAILCSDITRRKEVEEGLKKTNENLETQVRKRTSELREKNELLQIIFDTVGQGIFILKPAFGEHFEITDFTYVRVNKKVRRYYKRNDLVGQSFLEMNPKALETGAFEVFKKTMLTGKSKDFEVCFKRNGKKNWFKISTRRQRGLLVNSLENITRKKRRAEDLRDNIRFKKQLITTSPDVILIFNLFEGKIRYVNRDFLGNPYNSLQELIGTPLRDVLNLIHPADHKMALDFHNRIVKASDKDVVDLEFRLKGKEGKWIYYNVRAKIFMRNKDGHPLEYLLLLRNVQEEKKTQRALMDAQRLSIKGEIARTLAHELRNPLASVGLSADILDKRIKDPDKKEMANYINIIKRSTFTLNNLVTDLLTSSKYSPVVLRKCCLARTLNKVLSEANDRIYLSGIKVVKNYKGPCFILADKEKLKIALLNIIINAGEAMSLNKGVLTLSIEKIEVVYRLVITDNGCGMEQHQIEKLFDSYYTNKAGGLGVGLSSVKNILEEHGATVQVESQPDQGTSFILTFPCIKEESSK